MVRTSKEHADHALRLLQTHLPCKDASDWSHPVFVPIATKYNSPDLYGTILNAQNNFLDQHWNLVLAGISPYSMDSNSLELGGNSMWQTLHNLQGVYGVDISNNF